MRLEAADADIWYAPAMDVFLNHWFATYEQALAARQSAGGYLLPYRHHFFVCQAEAIRVMGLDPADPDWQRIGWDGARPADPEAYARLLDRRRIAAAPRPDTVR
jgi:hypothetical protein